MIILIGCNCNNSKGGGKGDQTRNSGGYDGHISNGSCGGYDDGGGGCDGVGGVGGGDGWGIHRIIYSKNMNN